MCAKVGGECECEGDSVQHGGWRVCVRVIALRVTMWKESVSKGVRVIQCNTVGREFVRM